MPSFSGKLLKLLSIFAAIWIVLAFILPALLEHVPAWRTYVSGLEEHNIESGALYYSDVPVTPAAEEHLREAVKAGMDARFAKAKKESGTAEDQEK